MNMQHGHGHTEWSGHGHAAWTSTLYTWACSVYWACSMDMNMHHGHGHGDVINMDTLLTWTRNSMEMNIQYSIDMVMRHGPGHTALTRAQSMDMDTSPILGRQHGHGHAAWTWTYSMDMEVRHGLELGRAACTGP